MTDPIEVSANEARAFLATSYWLREFPDDLRESLLASARLLPLFDRGKRVYNIGDCPNGIYGVVSGCFGFEVAPQEEGPQLIHQLRPGIWFGELAHVLERPRLAAVYATRPSQCMWVPAQALDNLLHSDPRLWKFFALALANATVFAFTAINDLIGASPKRRVAAALLRVAGCRDGPVLDQDVVELDLTHGNLALLSNCSRSTVAQYLKELETEGFVSFRYGRIIVTEPTALRQWLQTAPE
ncbi:Crp/Fnr family transcriptional regulator [Wenzhouxiangella sp. XN79A]|uniref:Crp/Fnr family transcriptional regulator n=1 Tax=Wenzhouxiangella sp. XN79A TaxID=2724193 RepID=UPI00144AD35B|nr:Crp/Fnr family transcriptional regulator [Wenzhouxiangella sp. XN79A]NKI34171.1 Crp/Fnr family transcriptional regulator [Wenzhouxiangella sp. XN79A]